MTKTKGEGRIKTSFTGKISQIGNSIGIIIPKNEVKLLRLDKIKFIRVNLIKLEPE